MLRRRWHADRGHRIMKIHDALPVQAVQYLLHYDRLRSPLVHALSVAGSKARLLLPPRGNVYSL